MIQSGLSELRVALDLSPADRRIRHHFLAQATDLNLVPDRGDALFRPSVMMSQAHGNASPGVKVYGRRPNYPKRINHESLCRESRDGITLKDGS